MMKTLINYINESLLDDEDIQVNNEDTIREDAILDWVKKYVITNRKDKIEITKDKNDNYIVNGDWIAISSRAQQIPVELFTFGTVNHFEVYENPNWKDLRGCPKVIKAECYIYGCEKLESLKGGIEEVGNFIITANKKLKSLEGCPKKIKGNVNMSGCESIKTLEGLGEMKKTKELYCSKCTSLESFKGAPKEVSGLLFSECPNLKSLDYIPKANKFIAAHDVPFTREDILKSQNIDIHKKSSKLIAITTRDEKDGMNTTEFYYI